MREALARIPVAPATYAESAALLMLGGPTVLLIILLVWGVTRTGATSENAVTHELGLPRITLLVFLHYECDGYRRDSFWRASSAVNLHSTLAPLSLRARSHAPLCPASVSLSGMRPQRHCRLSTENSISTWFSHEPCLGVWWNSSLEAMR